MLAVSSLGPDQLREITLSKKCQEDLIPEKFNHSVLTCGFCHLNVSTKIRKFSYLASLMPKEEIENEIQEEIRTSGKVTILETGNHLTKCSEAYDSLFNINGW